MNPEDAKPPELKPRLELDLKPLPKKKKSAEKKREKPYPLAQQIPRPKR